MIGELDEKIKQKLLTILGGETISGNTGWICQPNRLNKLEVALFNLFEFHIFLLKLFSVKSITSIPVKWDKCTSVLLSSYIL